MKFVFFLAFLSLYTTKSNPPISKVKISIAEPSDICYDPISNHFIVVSDEGLIKIMDRALNTIKMLKFHGCDFEAVSVVDSVIYVSDESGKRILEFSVNTYENIATHDIHNSGALNEGIEGLTYNPKTRQFIASYEKNPVSLIIMNDDFQILKRINLPMLSDISAITYFNGFLYVLSDEDASLSKLDINSYKVLGTTYFNVINPEGVAFLNTDSFVIVSDAEQKIYTFSNVEF